MRTPFMVEFTGTPEAGKTTSINNVAAELEKMGYTVSILRESAESLPKEIPKGTWFANLWMHYQTQSGLLKAKFMNSDIVLVDRGLIDSNFYGKKFLWEGKCSEEEYHKFRMQFMDDFFPDFLVALIVPPKRAVQRRGGEGRLVNEDYICNYNKLFFKYYNELECPKTFINTSKLTVSSMTKEILQEIVKRIP